MSVTMEQVRKWRHLPDIVPSNPYGDSECAQHVDIHTGAWLVYYAQRGAYIKIGQTNKLAHRLWTLNGAVSVPIDFEGVQLLAVEPAYEDGNNYMEYTRHQQFRRLRVAGEWFHVSPELTQHIENLRCPAPGGAA